MLIVSANPEASNTGLPSSVDLVVLYDNSPMSGALIEAATAVQAPIVALTSDESATANAAAGVSTAVASRRAARAPHARELEPTRRAKASLPDRVEGVPLPHATPPAGKP